MPRETVRVKGLREFNRACKQADKETRTEIRKEYGKVGEIVRVDASSRFATVDQKSADRFRTSIRQTGVFVVQSLRKTTGLRPDYGALQMRRALLPALESKEEEIVDAFDDATDRIADHFERRP